MADDIAQWLEGIGLGQYAQALAENAVDLETLPHLSDDDLKELGLPLGHRRKLQAALRDQFDHGQEVSPAASIDESVDERSASCPSSLFHPVTNGSFAVAGDALFDVKEAKCFRNRRLDLSSCRR